MQQMKLYSRPDCGWCRDAKAYLHKRGLPFEEIDVGQNTAAHDEMIRLSGQHYVPTLIVNGHVLANFDVDQLEKFLARLES